MTALYFDSKLGDDQRRNRVFSGDLFVFSPTSAARKLVAFARACIEDTFPGVDPRSAQSTMDVERFVQAVAPLKTHFTNHQQTKILVQDLLLELGCDLEKTYFDVPRLRVVTHSGYLTAGVGYAYKPHRDTWYAGPECQLNWWIPIYDLAQEQTMALYPSYFGRPVQNSSHEFDYDEWCNVGRQQAVAHVKTDTRKHPLPKEDIDHRADTRIVCEAAATLLFSGAHLHATVPNTSTQTRFSLDFRTVHVDDLSEDLGAINIDCAAKGSTVRDFLRANDFSPIPPQLVEIS